MLEEFSVEGILEKIPKGIPGEIKKGIPERISNGMPENIPECIPDKSKIPKEFLEEPWEVYTKKKFR